MKVMVVESPNKVKKIEAILGDAWKVVASVGHVRDLPRHELGLEPPDFVLRYEYIPPATVQGRTFPGGEDRVNRIRGLASRAEMIYLATDSDREGEAIAWHLKDALDLSESDYQRVTFDEITAPVITAAINQVRKIDSQLVEAQEARRALDRVVGYKVSPLLSDMLGQNLSAGRVQSVAVRLVVDLEKRIKAFRKTDHFGAAVTFDKGAWQAEWDTKPFTTEAMPYVLDEALAKEAAACRQFKVLDATSKTASEAPPSCFSTSLLLQAASVSLKLDPEVTSKLAQRLFEQGAITYIRTDSVNISSEAIGEIRALANGKGWALPDGPRRFKTKGGAQEAHEAIRPTHFEIEDAGEDEKQRLLYRLIWQRTVASQLADAKYKVNSAVLLAEDAAKPFQFKAKGRTLIEQGWRLLTAKDAIEDDGDSAEENSGTVPVLVSGSDKTADSGDVVRKATKAPSRYTKASLIKKLEAEGIGRPATYASIMSNIMQRGYLNEAKRFLVPTETGELVVDHLVKAGFAFMELAYTREMEEQLDRVAAGELSYLDVIEPAYAQLCSELEQVSGEFKPRFECPKCSSGLRKHQKPGKMAIWFCTNDECKTFLDDVDGQPQERQSHPCPNCETPLRRYQKKSGGGLGWFCPADECKTFMDDEKGRPIPRKIHNCPKCSAELRRFQKKDKETGKLKRGAFAWFCTNDECKTFMDDEKGRPVEIKTAPCPSCSKPMYRRKGQYGYWWGCSGFKDGCKVMMDDEKGKPVPKRPKAAKPAKPASKARSSVTKRIKK